MSWAGGKGDKRRPVYVDEATENANWNRIFGAKPEGSPAKDNEHGEAADSRESGSVPSGG